MERKRQIGFLRPTGDGPRLRCRRRPSCRRRPRKLPRGQGCRVNTQSDVLRIGHGERLPPRTLALGATPPQGGRKRSRRLWSSLIQLPPSTCGDEHRPGYHPSGLAIFPLLLRQPRHLQAQLLELPQPFLHRLDQGSCMRSYFATIGGHPIAAVLATLKIRAACQDRFEPSGSALAQVTASLSVSAFSILRRGGPLQLDLVPDSCVRSS